MQYYTQENNISAATPSGSKFLKKYVEAIDKDGKTYLKENGKTNIYDLIQASKDSAEIYSIIEKYQQTGDASVFNTRQTFYDNFINIPSTPIEMQNMVMEAERAFYELDKDVRAEFNNDVGEFKASIFNGTFDGRMSKFLAKTEPASTEQPSQTTNTNNDGGVNL